MVNSGSKFVSSSTFSFVFVLSRLVSCSLSLRETDQNSAAQTWALYCAEVLTLLLYRCGIWRIFMKKLFYLEISKHLLAWARGLALLSFSCGSSASSVMLHCFASKRKVQHFLVAYKDSLSSALFLVIFSHSVLMVSGSCLRFVFEDHFGWTIKCHISPHHLQSRDKPCNLCQVSSTDIS